LKLEIFIDSPRLRIPGLPVILVKNCPSLSGESYLSKLLFLDEAEADLRDRFTELYFLSLD
jgi:hypothetical protein